jgi:hypothetical protein
MANLDTLKLEIPPDAVRSVEWDGFEETQKTDLKTGLTESYRKAKSAYLPPGVSQVNYKDGGSYQVTLSAKTLRDNYLTGININTWEQAVRGIAPLMDVDPAGLWAYNPKVFRCDTTDNVSLELLGATQKGVCQSLLASKMNDRFISKWYESRKQLGIEFAGTQHEKNRLICYSKDLDLLKRQNQEFMKSLHNPVKMHHEAKNIIRVEVNHTAFKSIRDRLGIADNNLQSVLKASKPVNHNFLSKVLSAGKGQTSLFEQYEQMNVTAKQFIFVKGVESIILELGCNDIAVKQFFKQLLGDRFGYFYYKASYPIKDVLLKLKAEQTHELKHEVNTICRKLLTELLKAA